MTDADRARLADYHRVLADRMALKDWAIVIRPEHADEDAAAQVSCVDGRKLAKIRFDRDWAEQPPEELRQTCCHELLHCHLAPVRAEMARRLSKADFAMFEMLLEYAIDGIADGWAPCLPLMLSVHHEGDSPMGRQKTKPAATVKAPETKPKAGPKAGPKAPVPAPKGTKPGKG